MEILGENRVFHNLKKPKIIHHFPPMLKQASIKQFQNIYKQETGKEISHQEALIMAEQLIDLVRLVYRPIKKSEYEKWKTNSQKVV